MKKNFEQRSDKFDRKERVQKKIVGRMAQQREAEREERELRRNPEAWKGMDS